MIKSQLKMQKQNKEKIKISRSIQDTIPVDTVYSDGIFRMKNRFSKTYRFLDINFSIASDESKEFIIKMYKELLNSFDSSIMVKITINNRKIDFAKFKEDVLLKKKDDPHFDAFIEEYNQMLIKNMENCSNIIQEKYITITCFKKDIEEARSYFGRLYNEMSTHFKRLGSQLIELSLNERLKIFHDFYRPGEEDFFDFDMKSSARHGHSFKDDICPKHLKFNNGYFNINEKYGRALYFSKLPQYLDVEFLLNLCSLNKNMMFSIDFYTIPTDEAMLEANNKMLGVDTNIATFSQKQIANNNFATNPPYELVTRKKEIEEMMNDLTSRDERMMLANMTVVHLADTKKELDADTAILKDSARAILVDLSTIFLPSRQLDALVTTIPFGVNRLQYMVRTMLTEALATLTPFRAQEIMDKGGIYYGQNTITNNMIICNKEKLKNPNTLVLGVPGSGKSFLVKHEIEATMASSDDDIIICDPEGEYDVIMNHFGGEVIEIYAGGKDHINAMDITLGYGDSGDSYKDKAQFILSLIESVNRGTVSLEERSILDRCISIVYQKYEETGIMPTLVDLREELLNQPESQARTLALKMELFTLGSMNLFAHHTNVNTKNRIISFNIHKLDKNLKTMGLLVITDQIINRVNENWKNGKRTHVYIDEFHVVYSNPESATFFNSAWRQFRKRNAYPTAITQNVEYLLQDEESRSIFANTQFFIMLNQAANDAEELCKLLEISSEQMQYFKDVESGRGLIKFGSTLVPFRMLIDLESMLYIINSTKPSDLEEQRKRGLIK